MSGYDHSPDGRIVHLPGGYRQPSRPRTLAQRVTPLRRHILGLVAEGYTTGQIARRLARGEGTIRDHLEATYRALDARDRTHAVVLAYRAGLISLDRPAGQEPA